MIDSLVRDEGEDETMTRRTVERGCLCAQDRRGVALARLKCGAVANDTAS